MPEATVIAVGPGAPDKDGKVVPTNVKPGDRILLPGWGGNSIKVGDEACLLFFRFHSRKEVDMIFYLGVSPI